MDRFKRAKITATKILSRVDPEDNLESACRALMDDINERYPDKKRTEWKCPHLQRISDLLGYQ